MSPKLVLRCQSCSRLRFEADDAPFGAASSVTFSLLARLLCRYAHWQNYTTRTTRNNRQIYIYIYMQYDFDIARLYIREAPLRALYLHPLRKPKAREVFLPSDHAIPFTAWNLR